MKKIVLTLTVILAILGSVVTIVAKVLGAETQDLEQVIIIDHRYTLQQEYIIGKDVNELLFDTTDRSYVVSKSNKEYSYIEYHLETEKEKVEQEITNSNQLNFKIKKKSAIDFISVGFATRKVLTVKVYLLDDAIKLMDIDTLSGSIVLEEVIGLNKVNVKVASGTTTIKNIKVDNININSQSGSIKLENVTSNNIETSVQSGRTTLNKVTSDKASVDSTSGGVQFSESKIATSKIKVISGGVKIQDPREGVGFIVNATSGSITIYGERRKEVRDNLDLYKIKYTISVVSGSVKIEK